MNKQELIKKYVYMKRNLEMWVSIPDILEDLKQLDEPQKVVIPQYVADWIEYFKNCKGTLYGSTNPFSYYGRAILEDFEGDYEEVLRWIRDNSDTYARAWLDGYTVEKEKQYLVKMKDLETGFNLLNRHKTENYWIFSSKDESVTYQVCHTRKELEQAGFGWVFDCPGMEVDEVKG